MKRKNLLSMVLGTGMVVSLCAPMTVSADDMVTVTAAFPAYTDVADVDLVEAEINKILAERYQIQVDLTFIESGNWTQQTNLMLTSDEVDVLPWFATPLTTFVNNGQALPLDDYIANASDDFKAIWTEEQYHGSSVAGKIYGIPNTRNFGNAVGLAIDETIAAEYGIESGAKLTLEDIDTFYQWCHENYPERYCLAPSDVGVMFNSWTWDGLGDTKYIGVITDRGQDTTVCNLFETEDFKEFAGYTRSWYEANMIDPDVLSTIEGGLAQVQAGKAISFIHNYPTCAAANAGTINTLTIEGTIYSSSYSDLCYGINSLSAHPDEAWTLLQAFYTDADISTLLVDGIEGQHYVLNEDGTISYPEGKDYSDCGYGVSNAYWTMPFAANTHPLDVNGATFFEDLVDFNTNSLNSASVGFTFDSSEVADQYTACTNIMSKYYLALCSGAVDVESTIEQANEELYAAGLQDVIDAKQAQLDAFLAE